MSRTLHNKCYKTRVEIEGRAYRVVSFFHEHPSAIPEEDWTILDKEGRFDVICFCVTNAWP